MMMMKSQDFSQKVRCLVFAVCCLLTLGLSAARQPVIFETDMGNDVDDALALDMLYKYHRQGRIRLLAVMLNKQGPFPPQYIDLMNTWYHLPRIPIGLPAPWKERFTGGVNFTQTVSEKTDAKGRRLYRRSVKDYSSLPTAVSLYRRLLARAEDHSVTIVSVGFSSNLSLLLQSEADAFSPLSGLELVRRKVARLVTMAGDFGNPTHAEFNVEGDIAACQHVFAEWPTPIVTSPFELGCQICYPASSIENDFSWAPHHPMVDSYRAYLPKLEDRPTWDLTAVLYAVDPQQFFNISPAGHIRITPEGFMRFEPQAGANRYYLSVTPEQAQAIREYFVRMITKKP